MIDSTYLDHGGTTMTSKSLLSSFCKEMKGTLLANPHSDTSKPSASSVVVAETRLKVLEFFNADQEHFEVVFTANATAAVKLVSECFSGHDKGFLYHYHQNCHTSLVGVREVASRSHCFATDEETEIWLDEGDQSLDASAEYRPTLFAYPAQSNMNGARLPLSWSRRLRKSGNHLDTYTLLDVAAFVSTSPLDLSDHISAPDFTVLSFYKIFGFPDLGALIVRKASSHVLEHRKYFGGGTTEMMTCLEEKPWVVRKEASLHARLEDGTIAIRNILALKCAIDGHQQLFRGMDQIAKHTSWLAKQLYERLSVMSYMNGKPVCHFYQSSYSAYDDPKTQGATIAFNVQASDSTWIGPYAVGAMLRARNIHVRTGSLCNPAGMALALGFSSADLRVAFESGFRCNQRNDLRENGVPFGMVRITLGAMSTVDDIEELLRCLQEELIDHDGRMDRQAFEDAEKAPGLLELMDRHQSIVMSKSCSQLKRFWKAARGCLL
jgi:molybdenum cofactor sulfurtransferase